MSPYLQKLKAAFPEKNEAQLELMCAGRWDIERSTGVSRHNHRLASMRLLFPHRTEHEWRNKMVWSWHDAREVRKLQEIGWMGSAMSNKTGTMGDTLLELFWEDPANTTIYVASPTKDATARRLWAELQRSFKIATEKWGLPGTLRKGEITYGSDDLRAGIFMVSADDHGTLIGANNPDVTGGKLIVATDELPNIPGQAAELLSAIENLKMRKSFVFLYAGNFAEVDDGMGRAAMPAEGGYESLDPDVDMEWLTARRGKVYRFDGMQSPNVLAKKDIYPFLTRWERVRQYLERGETDTAEFMRWIRSFPVLGLEAKTVTNSIKISANFADTDPNWDGGTLIRGLTVDPGFGGDPCVAQPVTLGKQRNSKSLTLDFSSPPLTIPIRVAKKGDPREKQKEAERQIVAWVKDYCERENIDPENVIFDGSMRSGIVQAFNGWSSRVIAVDFGGSASGRQRDAMTKKTWHDEASNFVTELWMAMGDAIMSGQIRGLHRAVKAARQFCSRRWKWSGKKKQIIPKDDYKKMNEGQSPNEADACVLGLEWGRRRGLVIAGNLPLNRLTADMISKLLGMSQSQTLPKGCRLAIGEPAVTITSRLER
jgi:hypothetical protein